MEDKEYMTERENRIYEATKDFGRTQFVREIAAQQRENKQLRDNLDKIKNVFEKSSMFEMEELLEIDECLKIKNIVEEG